MQLGSNVFNKEKASSYNSAAKSAQIHAQRKNSPGGVTKNSASTKRVPAREESTRQTRSPSSKKSGGGQTVDKNTLLSSSNSGSRNKKGSDSKTKTKSKGSKSK